MRTTQGGLTTVVAADDREEVHGAGLGDAVADEPEALVVAEFRGLLLRAERRRVVERELVPASATGPRADVLVDREQGDRARACAEEWACRAENDVQRCTVGRRHAKGCRGMSGESSIHGTERRMDVCVQSRVPMMVGRMYRL